MTRIRFIIFLAILTIFLALPRFAHTTPDSEHYIALARYFQTNTGREALVPPYAYRILVPWLASFGPPSSPGLIIAIISVLSTLAAYAIFYLILVDLAVEGPAFRVGMLMLVLSFPTLNYASAVLTDAAGFFCISLAVYMLLRKRYWLFALVTSVSVLTRESNLVLVLAFWIYLALGRRWYTESRPSPWYFLLGLLPIGIYLLVRVYFSDLRAYYWVPTLRMLFANLLRPVSWVTFLLTLAPPLGLILAGLWRGQSEFLAQLKKWDNHQRSILASVGIACLLLLGYSLVSAFMSGRFVWPLYLVLIPIASQGWRATGWSSRLPILNN